MTDIERAEHLLAGWPTDDDGRLIIARASAVRDIAMLLGAVRERCAQIVETHAVVFDGRGGVRLQRDNDPGYDETRLAYAAAIRATAEDDEPKRGR